MIRIGELCAGYGGLGMGIQIALRYFNTGPAQVSWVADNDKGASAILDYRFPGIPNHGDITQIDWRRVRPPDILAAGFPCQDISCAGVRRGLRAGTRSGVWSHVAEAIDALRPPLVILENVEGLLSAKADSGMEHCPWCLGDDESKPAVRALGAVLGDLAEIGFDAEWLGVSASEAGAPHRRRRVFIAAWPSDPHGDGHERRAPSGFRGLPWRGRGPAEEAKRDRDEPAAHDERHRLERAFQVGRPGPEQPGEDDPEARGGLRPVRGGHDPAEDPDPAARDQRRQPGPGEAEGRRPRANAGRRGIAPAAHGDVPRLGQFPGVVPGAEGTAHGHVADSYGRERPFQDWGPFERAIRRWESVLGRHAPAPVEPGRGGKPRLSAPFAEWMMGLPEGWVTQVPGLSRNDHLKAIGNGVVPQQAALAVRALLDVVLGEAKGGC